MISRFNLLCFIKYDVLQNLMSAIELMLFHSEKNDTVQLNPGLYPILIVLGRLCPSVAEGAKSSLCLEELVPFVVR